MPDEAIDSDDTVRGMFGPDVTFLGVPRADLGSLSGLDVVFLGAPFDMNEDLSGAVSNPAVQLQLLGQAMDEGTIADTLNPAGNSNAPCLWRLSRVARREWAGKASHAGGFRRSHAPQADAAA